MLLYKLDQVWPFCLRNFHVLKCKYIGNVSAVKGRLFQSDRSDLAWIGTPTRLYACPNYLKVGEDPSKYECASLETLFSYYKSMIFFRCSRAGNSEVNRPIRPVFEPTRDFMLNMDTCKFDKDPIKIIEETWRYHFPHYKSMGAFGCHHDYSFSFILLMRHIKFDQA